jgi:hypothetical protein
MVDLKDTSARHNCAKVPYDLMNSKGGKRLRKNQE